MQFHFRKNSDNWNDLILYPAFSKEITNGSYTIDNCSSTLGADPLVAWNYTSTDTKPVTITVDYTNPASPKLMTEQEGVEVPKPSYVLMYGTSGETDWVDVNMVPGEEITLTGVEGKNFLVKYKGSYDTNYDYYGAESVDAGNIEAGNTQTYGLITGDNKKDFTLPNASGAYKFTLNVDVDGKPVSITVNAKAVVVHERMDAGLYIGGEVSMNGTKAKWEGEAKALPYTNGVYEKVTVAPYDNGWPVKIVFYPQDELNYNNRMGSVQQTNDNLFTVYTAEKGKHEAFTFTSGEYELEIISYDASAGTVKFRLTTGKNNPDLYVAGHFSGSWPGNETDARNNAVKIETDEDGNYLPVMITRPAGTKNGFSFYSYYGGENVRMGRPENMGDDDFVAMNREYTAVNSEDAYMLPNVTDEYVLQVKSFDPETKTVVYQVERYKEKDYKYFFVKDGVRYPDSESGIVFVDGKARVEVDNMRGQNFGVLVEWTENGESLSAIYTPFGEIDADDVREYTMYETEDYRPFPNRSGEIGQYIFNISLNAFYLPSVMSITPPMMRGYNNTLYVGVASNNRHEIELDNEAENTYKPYYFYVSEEDINELVPVGGYGDNYSDSQAREVEGFGFRFYSEPTGGVWMGQKSISFIDVEGTPMMSPVALGEEITTNGIKRYFINEAGHYVIKVKNYDPIKGQVTFTIEKNTTNITATDLWLGLDGQSSRSKFDIKNGDEYQDMTVTVTTPGQKFNFFSAPQGGTVYSPVGNHNVIVDPAVTDNDGNIVSQMVYTTRVGDTNRVFTFEHEGTYVIKVREFDVRNGRVIFTAELKSVGTSGAVPQTLYLYPKYKNSSWGSSVIEMTKEENANGPVYRTTVEYTGGEYDFLFVENTSNGTVDWNNAGLVCYPFDRNENMDVEHNVRKTIGYITDAPDNRQPKGAWKYQTKTGYTGQMTIIADFSGSLPKVLVETAPVNYYFIGDMNDWYSVEFQSGNESNRGINAEKFAANCDRWKFTYEGDGWYSFSNFPNKMLSGEFQIVGGGSWDPAVNEVYSHIVTVDYDNPASFKNYSMNSLTRKEIREGTEYRIRRRYDSNEQGTNIALECNAVVGKDERMNPKLWFRPGAQPRIKIEGTPVDFFIFYNMSEVADNANRKTDENGHYNPGDYLVRAYINSGKPNENNYYLPGIENLPFYDANGNDGPHMNISFTKDGVEQKGIDLAPYDLNKMTRAELNNLFFQQSEVLGEETPGKYDYVNWILKNGTLPNGQDVQDLPTFETQTIEENGETKTVQYRLKDETDKEIMGRVWIAKIPSGFESPAGTKYNMSFDKAMTEDDRNADVTINNRSLYFFPQTEGVHVHINADQFLEAAGWTTDDITVEYRIYNTNENYDVVTVDHGADANGNTIRNECVLYAKGTAMPSAYEETDEAKLNQGWYRMEVKESSNWLKDGESTGYSHDRWFVSWDAPASAVENDSRTDYRREVHHQDRNSYIQFRITMPMANTPSAMRRANGNGTMTTYVPNSTDVADDENHFSFGGRDFYTEVQKDNGIWTELREIIEEAFGNVDPGTYAPVYYNLQGVKVNKPVKGEIYIEVRGNRSTKIVY